MVSVGRGSGRRGAAHMEPKRLGIKRKKQKTTKQQTKKNSKLDSQPY
jgi:hypothetical protein